MSTFRDLLSSDPSWLATPKAKAWRRCVLDQKDATADRLKQAVKQRFFGVAYSDALAKGGAERGLERAAADTDAVFASRLVDAWALWAHGGDRLGLLTALHDAGYPGAAIGTALGLLLSFADGAREIRYSDAAPAWTLAVTGGAAVTTVHSVLVAVASLSPTEVEVTIDGEYRGMGFLPMDLGEWDVALTGSSITITGTPGVGKRAWLQVGPELDLGLMIAPMPAGGWDCDASSPLFWSKFCVLLPDNPWGKAVLVTAPAWQEMTIVAEHYRCLSDSKVWIARTAGTTGVEPYHPAGVAGAVVVDNQVEWLCLGAVGAQDWIRPLPDDARIDQIRRLVRQWKDAKSTCSGITVINAGGCWGYPLDAWAETGDAWDVWGGSDVLTYSA